MADPQIRMVNKIYILGLAVFLIAGLALLFVRLRREGDDDAKQILLTGSALQLLFLLSLNSRWAFLELPRYFIPLFPAAFLGLENYLPKNRFIIAAIGIAAALIAVYAEVSGNRYAN